LKNDTSRRDFVKAALAASVAGVAAPAGASNPDQPAPPQPKPVRISQAGANEIAFPRVFTGRRLARISCPLGGIGTGGIGLGGRGNLQDWQIFNRSDIGNSLEYAFPGMWIQSPGADPYSVVLERRILPPYDLHQEGLGSANAPGLPRLAEAKFFGSFPLSRIEFEDPDCPVNVTLEAFSPFYPLDADDSGLPCAILQYQLRNPGKVDVEAVIAWSISNPVGNSTNRKNNPRSSSGLNGLFMTDPSLASDDPMHGSFVLAAMSASEGTVETLASWLGGSTWRVGPQHFWFDEFSQTGNLGKTGDPSMPVGSVSIRQTIPAGDTRVFRFLLAWHFPNRTPERCGWDAPKGEAKTLLGNYYSTRFPDAWAVAEHVSTHRKELEKKTRTFVDLLAQSTVPAAVKDAAASNLSTLVSNTSFRIADGSFHGFEGCGDIGGLGFGSCTHVWNYEVATQFLFPTIARSMRETSFGYATDARGHMDFRHKLPLGMEHWGAAAADGQMGQIVKLYFDWALSGDDRWLRHQWPAAKRALAYAWRPGGWDERKSGVMDGVQHTTYDVEFYGPNPTCSTWYLAALLAMSQMATAMGDSSLSEECARLHEAGSRWIEDNLFNGEFYIQKIRGIPADQIASGLRVGMGSKDTMDPDFQVGDGCFVDQLVGQYMATVAGLGDLLDPDNIHTALHSIYHYNYKRTLIHHASVQRVYPLNDEAAVLVCDFTKGTRPRVPMPYYAEAWTGLEHSVAALMITHGMVNEGIEIVRSARNRYDGEKANPYDETEYGRHYARAMSSWAPFAMLSGFRYDARAKRLTLAPRIHAGGFRCFWSAPAAWGEFELSPRAASISCVSGAISLTALSIHPPIPGALRVTVGDQAMEHTASTESDNTLLEFSSPVQVDPDNPLRVQA
jgi:non-lysosomal glucosylceramidase